MRWDRATTDAVFKIILRSLPIIPAPEIYDLVRSVGRSEKDVDNQIREAFDALSKSSDLVADLERMLKDRESKLVALRAEYERISELSTLTQAQANAVASSLEKTLGKSAGRERWISFLINIVAGLILFVVGVFASDWVKGLIS